MDLRACSIVWFISRKTVFFMDQNDTHSRRASGGSSEGRVLNRMNCDFLQQENCYHLKALDHLDQIQLKIHYLTNFKCGYQTHVLGRVAFAPRIWGARAPALGLARQWLGEAVGYGQRKLTLVDPTLCHALCWEKCDPRRLWSQS